MTTTSPGPGWWQASDDHWYPPETHPDLRPPPPPSSVSVEAPLGDGDDPRPRRSRKWVVPVVVLVVVILAAIPVVVGRQGPLALDTINAMPQLAILQGTSCTRQGSNATASGIVHDQTVAPMTVTVLVATGSKAAETAQRTVTVNFAGGVLNPSSEPWQVSLPANGAPSCYVISKAAVNLP